MLEDLIRPVKKGVLSLALISSILPSPSQAYTSRVNIDGNEVLMQTCEDSKIMQAQEGDWTAFKKAAMLSLIYHEKSLLENDVADLDYSTYKLVKDSFSQSSVLSKKVNKAIKWFDPEEQKLPWWTFVFYGLPVKFFASKEAAYMRSQAKGYLGVFEDRLRESPTNTYRDIEAARQGVRAVKKLMDETNELTQMDLPFTLEEMSEFEEKTKKGLNYLDGDQLEKELGQIKSRIIDRVRAQLRDSQPGKDYAAAIERIKSEKGQNNSGPFKVIDTYSLINNTPDPLFKEEYLVETTALRGQAIPKKVDLSISASKLCNTETGYQLVLRLKINGLEELIGGDRLENLNIIEPRKTNITIIYPNGTSFGEISESARLVYRKDRGISARLEEMIPSSTEKIDQDGLQVVSNKALHLVAESNVMRTKNALQYLAEKISNIEKAEDQASVELIKEKLRGYESKQIELFDSNKQGVEYFVSIPLSNTGQKPVFVIADVGVRSWLDSDNISGKLEDVLIKIDDYDQKRVGNPSYPGWIIPSSWMHYVRGIAVIKIPLDIGSMSIDPNNGKSEYATVNIAGTKYSFIDSDFVKEYSLDKSTEPPYSPIKLSSGPLHFQFLQEGLTPEIALPGIYFAEEEKIKSFIRERRPKPSPVKKVSEPPLAAEDNTKKIPNPFYHMNFGGGILGGAMEQLTQPLGTKDQYIDLEKLNSK